MADSDHGAIDLQSAAGGGTSAVVVLAVEVDIELLDSLWRVGPLPINQPQNDTTRHHGHNRPTDEEARRTLVEDHQADLLYGSSYLLRRHRVVSHPFIAALELLCEPTPEPGFAVLAVHVTPAGKTIEDLLAWLRQSVRRQRGAEVLGAALEIAGSGIAGSSAGTPRVMSYTKLPEAVDNEELPRIAAYAMASGSSPTDWRNQAERAGDRELLIAKPDWSVMVMRDGASYVSHDRSTEPYSETLRMLVHSVHLDALLLALVQRALIDRSGRKSVVVPLDEPQQLVELESGHYEFQRTFWRTALTRKRTAPPDLVLHAFQNELLTTADVLDVERRVNDGARLALSLHARQQQQTQLVQARAQARLNRMVQTGSVVIGSFALAFTAAPVIAEPSWTAFWVALMCGAAAMVAAFALLSLTGRRAGI